MLSFIAAFMNCVHRKGKRLFAAQSLKFGLKPLKMCLCRYATGSLFFSASLSSHTIGSLFFGASLGGAGTGLSSQPTGVLFLSASHVLVVSAKITLGPRVEEPQPPILPAHIQSQHIAVPTKTTFAYPVDDNGLIHAVNQPVPGKRRIVVLAATRVKPPVFCDMPNRS